MSELLRIILFLPEQASTFAQSVDRLHYFVIITTFIASFVIGTLAIFFFVRYRRRSPDQTTRPVRGTLAIEILFVALPLAFFLAWVAIGFRDFARLSSPPPDAMDVFVMGKQWMWQFAYPGGPNAQARLTVPARRPVRLLLTSRDVIHSFYVPEFRIKMDALPGRYTQTWFEATRPGRYRIYCTEYCGLRHSLMRGEVEVLEPEAFDRWIEEQRAGVADRQDASAPDGMVAQGERVAARQGCFNCHTTDGTRHIGPSWQGLYHRRERMQSGEQVLADEAYLSESMMRPRARVVAGYEPVMPSFQGRLEPGEVAALIELIRSLRGEERL